MSCKIWGWWNGWRNHKFSELQLNMWECSPGPGRGPLFCEWEVDGETLQWPRSQWERTGRLMRFWTDKQLLWKTCCPEASLPLSPILQPQVALCLDPQTSTIRLEMQGSQGPKSQFLTRHWPQQCPPQTPLTQIWVYCCNKLFPALQMPGRSSDRKPTATNSCSL